MTWSLLVVESVPDRTPAAGRPPRAKGTYDRCPLFSPSHSDGKGLGEGKTLDEPLPASSCPLPAREDARRPPTEEASGPWEGLGGARNPVVASARRPTERSPLLGGDTATSARSVL